MFIDSIPKDAVYQIEIAFEVKDEFEAIAKVEGIIEWHSEDFKKWLEKTK